MVNTLLGGGVTTSNITYTGDNSAAGTFAGMGAVGFDSGVVLSTGAAAAVVGPNAERRHRDHLRHARRHRPRRDRDAEHHPGRVGARVRLRADVVGAHVPVRVRFRGVQRVRQLGVQRRVRVLRQRRELCERARDEPSRQHQHRQRWQSLRHRRDEPGVLPQQLHRRSRARPPSTPRWTGSRRSSRARRR